MFKYYNANSHNRNISDCFIRCLSVLTNRRWLDVYKEVSNLAGRQGMMFSDVEFVEDYLDDRYDREKHHAITVGEFAEEHPYNKYAVTMTGHITAIINGEIIDTFDCSDRLIRCAWRID